MLSDRVPRRDVAVDSGLPQICPFMTNSPSCMATSSVLEKWREKA
jgi:hypothetical protein